MNRITRFKSELEKLSISDDKKNHICNLVDAYLVCKKCGVSKILGGHEDDDVGILFDVRNYKKGSTKRERIHKYISF